MKRHAVGLRESGRWQLSDNWTYELEDGTRIILPQGFEFDGASIPRTFWALLSPVGLLLIPGLIHDYGYKYDQLWQVTIQLLQWGHWGVALEGQDERVDSIVGLFAAS